MGSLLLSCDNNDDPVVQEEEKVLVQFTAKPVIENSFDKELIDGLHAVFTNVRNQDTTHCVLNQEGTGTASLYKGTYDVSIEEKGISSKGDSIYLSVKMENVSINATGQTLEGNLHTIPVNSTSNSFIFSEVFFNGERNSGRMMHPDQYIVIFNPTMQDLYADGLCIASANQPSCLEKEMWFDSYYPDRVPLTGFITIPGSGKEHLVKPGEKLVIAFTAINHSATEGYDHAVDLSGADFEIYYGPDSKDVDNPEVPNVLISDNADSYTGGFYFHPRGFYAPLMFKLADGKEETVKQFFSDNLSTAKQLVPATEETPEEIIEVKVLSVPTADILDGVQTGLNNFLVTRSLPELVDRGEVLVPGCHSQKLTIRKEIVVGKQIFYQDTNNSKEDFFVRDGQTAFPVGWRNK